MNQYEYKPVFRYPDIRRKYKSRANTCKSLDNQRIFIIKYQYHLKHMMDKYHEISEKLDRLWQENIDIYDKANEKIIKQ